MIIIITLWLMEPEVSMPHSQGPSNNPYPQPNNSSSRSIITLFSNLCVGFPGGLFPVGLAIKIFKALSVSSSFKNIITFFGYPPSSHLN